MRVRSRAAGNPNGANDQCLQMYSGSTDDYTINIGTGTSNIAYDWTTNNTFLSATNISNPVAQNVTSTQTYTVKVTTSSGCTAISAPVTVNVIPAPIGTISASAICPSGSVNLTFTSTVGTGPFNIVVNGITYTNVVSGSVFATITLSVQSTTYTLTSIKDNGVTQACVSTVSNAITIAFPVWYDDVDLDGFGNPAVSLFACTQPSGYVTNNTDCNDGNAAIHPGATEICGNGIDENCNGMLDDVCTSMGITFNLKVFIQGFYDPASHSMVPVLSNAGVSIDPLECDTITVEFYDPLNLASPFISANTMLYVDGTATMQLPPAVQGNTYYIVVKYRNAIETWSKDPVLFTGNPVTFDFTTP